jgi:hypothetical protein
MCRQASTWVLIVLGSASLINTCSRTIAEPIQRKEHTPVGVWDVRGVDAQNTEWIGTMVLLEGKKGGLVGHIDWSGSNGCGGREYVDGSFDGKSRVLDMAGTKLEHARKIVLGKYKCELSEDGERLKGRWGGEDVIAAGWIARRIELRK